MAYRLLNAFRKLFQGRVYLHRASNLGDMVAQHLYEDLFMLEKSQKLIERINNHSRVLNVQNRTVGIKARRGDGTFGEIVPALKAISDTGYAVGRGPIATIEIGTETKILAKAMKKQIDRVVGDLTRQVGEFKRSGGNPICVGLVGINYSEKYISFEGDRSYPTDGKKYKHPIQEALDMERVLREQAQSEFDHFLILKFKATNIEPYPFEWINQQQTENEYGAILIRISRDYEDRF